MTITLKAPAQDAFFKDLHPFIINEFKKIRELGADTIFIYEKYCTGCEVRKSAEQNSELGLVSCVYEGFLQGKILWKINNKSYSKVISCASDNSKTMEITSEIFEYFFSNLNRFKSVNKYKFNGRFLPPIAAHSSYENLRLYTPKIIHNAGLAEQQKEDTNWKNYEWIPPTIQIMKMIEKTFS